MSLASRTVCAAAAAVAITSVIARPAAAEIYFSDTYLSIRNLWQDKQPGYAGNVDELAGNISYANGWTYGSNFVSLDIEQFGHQDPANIIGYKGQHANANSLELYSVFRTVFSGNKISGTKNFAFGPIADIGFELGLDLDTQDDQFASYKRLLVVGPNFSIAIPKGFLNIGVHLSKEWNTSAYSPTGGQNFNVAPELEIAWMYPFNVGSVPVKFEGYFNVVGPKGKGYAGAAPTGTEILAHPKLMVDVGAVLGAKPGQFDAGVGYEYWHNKFGNQSKYLTGTQQSAFFVEAGYHF